MTTVDGRWLNENERMRLLRNEEAECLGLDTEYRSGNAITSMRQMHPATTAMVHTLPGEVEPPPSAAARSETSALDSISADEGCFPAGAGEEVLA